MDMQPIDHPCRPPALSMKNDLVWETLTEAFAARKGGDRDLYTQRIDMNASGGRAHRTGEKNLAPFYIE